MENRSTIQQLKSNRGGSAIASLILGVISVIPLLVLFSRSSVPYEMVSLGYLSIIGIIFGIRGLRSRKKNIAIGGIIFSIIGLLGLIIFLLLRLGFEMM